MDLLDINSVLALLESQAKVSVVVVCSRWFKSLYTCLYLVFETFYKTTHRDTSAWTHENRLAYAPISLGSKHLP